MNTILKAALTVALLCAFSTGAFAKDLKQGTFQLSGATAAAFGSSTEKADGEKIAETDIFDIELSGYYHVATNVGIGLMFLYNDTDYKYPGYPTQNVSQTLIGPAIQFSIPMNHTTNFVLGAGAGYAAENVDGSYDASGYFYAAKAGLALFPIDNVSVDLGVSYINQKGDDAGLDLERGTVSGSVGLSVYF